AQETTKRYLLYEQDKEEKVVKVLHNNIQILEEAFKELVAVQSEELRDFTDLVVDVLSSEDIHASEYNQDESSEQHESGLEKKKSSSKFTKEQIEA
ncbi:unnamed protein product, partial [Larinioides sclopetarius]